MNIKNPKVSVITCAYNSERFILNTIESVLNQSYKNIEYIIVYSPSSDRTWELIERFKKRVVIYTIPPRGIGYSMNYGVKKSKGNIICHLHSDDFFLNKDVVKNIINRFKCQKTKWGFGITLMVNTNGNIIKRMPHKFIPPLPMFQYICSIIPHQSTFIKKEIFDEYGFFDESSKFCDYDFFLRVWKNEKPFYLKKEITVRLVGGWNLSKPTPKNIFSLMKYEYKTKKKNLNILIAILTIPSCIIVKIIHLIRMKGRWI